MSDLDDDLDELQSILAGPRFNRPNAADLVERLAAARDTEPEDYASRWLPYLEEAPLPRIVAETYEGLLELTALLPPRGLVDIDFDDEVEGDTLVEVLVQHRAHIHEFTINMCELEALRVVLSHPVVASLPAIRLGGIDAYWGPDALELLVEADLPSLRSLSLFGASELQDEHCRILAAAPNLRGLRVLRLERPAWQGIPMHEITDDGVLALVAAFPGLSWLDLAGCASASDAVLPAVAALRELSAFAVPGVSGSGAALAWSDPSLPGLVARLTHLDLSESGVDVSRVLDGPTRLRYLQLARTVADPEQVGRLAETEGLTELRHLGFFDATDWDSIDESGPEGANPISRDDVEAFMDNPRFPELQYVDFLNADDYPEAMHRGPDGAWEESPELTSGHEPRYPAPQ